MSALFRLRKIRRRLISDSKGFSSIVGAVFAALVMISLISTAFVWSLSQNTLYNNTVTQTRQIDLDRSNEKTVVLNTTYTPYNNSKVNVYAQIQNIGSSSIQFITVWLYTSNSTWTNYNFTSLVNASVQGGSTFTLNVNLTATGVNSNSTYSFSSWLITARGNTVALQTIIVGSNVIISSQVAQGIGSISMDFKQFNYYDFGSSSPSNGTNMGTPLNSFNMANGNYTILSVVLTNYDNSTQDIILGPDAYIWIAVPQGGTMKSQSWSIANVTNNKYITSFSTQRLIYSQPTPVYFGPMAPGFAAAVFGGQPKVFAVFILLFGQVAGKDFGQNIPFVAFKISP